MKQSHCSERALGTTDLVLLQIPVSEENHRKFRPFGHSNQRRPTRQLNYSVQLAKKDNGRDGADGEGYQSLISGLAFTAPKSPAQSRGRTPGVRCIPLRWTGAALAISLGSADHWVARSPNGRDLEPVISKGSSRRGSSSLASSVRLYLGTHVSTLTTRSSLN